MLLPILLAAAALSFPAASGAGLSLQTSGSAYSVAVNGKTWLNSGDTAFHANNKWYKASDGSLKCAGGTDGTGSDAFGSYRQTSCTWNAPDGSFAASTSTRVYSSGNIIVFDQTWIDGAEGTAQSGVDDIIGSFPSFSTSNVTSETLGTAVWHGTFIDASTNGPQIGTWPSHDVVSKMTQLDGGVMVLFAGDGSGDTLVISAASEFMSASFGATLDNQISAGPFGAVTSIPKGYSQSFIIYYGSTGINNAMTAWGNALLKYYNKPLDGPERDFTINTLGYSTDHGAYYYYKPAPGSDFNQTLVAVQEYAEKVHIPYQWILLDSWWYFQGSVDHGCMNWTARPDIFPPGGTEGLKQFNDITQWPIIGHNRYWSVDTQYAKENGGDFDFSPAISGKYMVPLEQRFWDFLMQSSKEWGLRVYEQDWLYNELRETPILTENVTMARTWLMQMGSAALKNGLTIQYCMPYPRHALQSVEIQAVTQIRASDDYVPNTRHTPTQWHIGGSSMLAHALALRPYKDSFWTQMKEPNGSCGDAVDLDIVREAIVSTLSAGPVSPSDAIGISNVELIMRSSATNGFTLQPTRPATLIDAYFGYAANSSRNSAGPDGQVWATYTAVGPTRRWDHVFSAELQSPYSTTPADLRLDQGSTPSAAGVAWSLNTTTLSLSSLRIQDFSSSSPIQLSVLDPNLAELWHTAPVEGNGMALLGEMDKWVPVSVYRFKAVSADSSKIVATVQGKPGEVVHVSFAEKKSSSNEWSVHTVDVTIGTDGTASVSSS